MKFKTFGVSLLAVSLFGSVAQAANLVQDSQATIIPQGNPSSGQARVDQLNAVSQIAPPAQVIVTPTTIGSYKNALGVYVLDAPNTEYVFVGDFSLDGDLLINAPITLTEESTLDANGHSVTINSGEIGTGTGNTGPIGGGTVIIGGTTGTGTVEQGGFIFTASTNFGNAVILNDGYSYVYDPKAKTIKVTGQSGLTLTYSPKGAYRDRVAYNRVKSKMRRFIAELIRNARKNGNTGSLLEFRAIRLLLFR